MTEIDPDRAHPARIYDYLLGGACNFEPDRALAEKILQAMPGAAEAAKINRAYLRRAVRYCAEQGITQFLDLGSGIPTVGNVHETAPGARVVYVDNDPIAVAHSEIELGDTPGAAAVLADFNDADAVLAAAGDGHLDLDKPIAVLMVAVLHFIEQPHAAVNRYIESMTPGSHLAITHGTVDSTPENSQDVINLYRNSGSSAVPRTRDEVTALFGDLELIPPGVVWTPLWRPESPQTGDPAKAMAYAGLARKV
ncbi:SAM-dependent methyltransferase [Actinokineospora auranticolor]|uniref:S-adenosyl methyltransferase n=1 Tax=Actinokineospora auranticolor TaxID=155976 RepID=A0A2S6GBG6_9PSEU|nr:SAM-dependent methyltransferase [Actinokineospora auranticolor]PPK61339.1 S-adenosyl methyltransferase [Actinokineospora auranticolor]